MRSDHELKRLVERAVGEACELAARGLVFQVDALETSGRPPSVIDIWATLHFLPSGSPYCCGEPGCHLGLEGDRLEDVSDRVRRAMGFRQPLSLVLAGRIAANLLDGVDFSNLHGTGARGLGEAEVHEKDGGGA